jgi:hypothetical protein
MAMKQKPRSYRMTTHESYLSGGPKSIRPHIHARGGPLREMEKCHARIEYHRPPSFLPFPELPKSSYKYSNPGDIFRACVFALTNAGRTNEYERVRPSDAPSRPALVILHHFGPKAANRGDPPAGHVEAGDRTYLSIRPYDSRPPSELEVYKSQ